MRSLWTSLVAILLLAGPSLGVINVSLSGSGTLVVNAITINPGDTATIYVWAQGTVAGLYSLGGNTVASGDDGTLATNAGSGVWIPLMTPGAPFVTMNGVPGPNGGMTQFGSETTYYLNPDEFFAKAALVQVYNYTVTAQPNPGPGNKVVTLTFTRGTYGGYKPCETDKTTTMGTITGMTITVTPEPVTLALLAVGGLLAAPAAVGRGG